MINAIQSKEPSEDAPRVEWAVYYAKMGIPVFPIKPRTKDEYYPDYEHLGKPTKKHPKGTPYSWAAQATTDIERVKKAFQDHPEANIGGVMGNGLYGVDVDIRTDGNGFDFISKWEQEKILPGNVNFNTWTSITGSGSRQFFYYLLPEYVENARNNYIDLAGDAGMIEPDSHVDTRGDGRYVVLPPSLHPNGNRYRWDDDKKPSTICIADFDRTIEYLFTHKGSKAKNPKGKSYHKENDEKVPKGSRRAYILSKVGELVNKMIDITDDRAIVAAAMQIAHDDLDTSEPLDSGWDGLERDIESMVYDFRSAIEKEREDENRIDWSYSVRAWYLEHPGEKLSDPVNWDEVRAAGERRKNNELQLPESKSNNSDTIIEQHENIPYILTDKGKIIKDLRNYVAFVENSIPKKIRYNSFSKRIEIFGNIPWNSGDDTIRTWQDSDTFNLSLYACELGLKDVKTLENALLIVAKRNLYNPLTEFLEGLQYNGDGYIRKLLPEYMGADDSEYVYQCMRLLMLAMVSRAYYPGIKFDNVPVLMGAQGSYKSTFWTFLCRNDMWFSDSVDSFSDRKKLGELIQGKWLVELGEMSAFKKSEMESIKACITSRTDSYREAYGHFRSDYPRITCFVGTTNQKQFLKDSTGNRRFLVIQIDPDKRTKNLFTCETRDQDFNNAWAEAVHIFKDIVASGKPISLTLPKEVVKDAEKLQELANEYEEWKGIIEPWLQSLIVGSNLERSRMETCALDIWCNCFKKDKGTFTRREAQRINEVLESLPDWEKTSGVRIEIKSVEPPFMYRGRGFKHCEIVNNCQQEKENVDREC